MKIEVTIKMTITIDDNAPIEESLKDRIINDVYESLDPNSSFQADDDCDYDFTYDKFIIEDIKNV